MGIKFTTEDLTEEGKIVLNHYIEYHKDISGFAKECIKNSIKFKLKEKDHDRFSNELIMSMESLSEADFSTYLSSLEFCTKTAWFTRASKEIISYLALPMDTYADTRVRKGINILTITKKVKMPIKGGNFFTNDMNDECHKLDVTVIDFVDIFCNSYIYKKLKEIIVPDDFGKLFPGCSCSLSKFEEDEDVEDYFSCKIEYDIPFCQISRRMLKEVSKELSEILTLETLL